MSELEQMQKDIREIAGYVNTLAKAVMVKNEGMYDEEYPEGMPKKQYPGEEGSDAVEWGMDKDHYPGHENGEEENHMLDAMPTYKDGENGEYPPMDMNGDGHEKNEYMDMMEDDEEEYDDFQSAYKAIKALQRLQKRNKVRKGYAAAAKVNTDEHDAPFDEKDSDIGGNEPQEGGKQGGDRENETFGPGGMAYSAMRKQLNSLSQEIKEIAGGTVIAKAQTPSGSGGHAKSGDGDVLTRDMQVQAKGMSFKALNKIREEMGDLPRNLITG